MQLRVILQLQIQRKQMKINNYMFILLTTLEIRHLNSRNVCLKHSIQKNKQKLFKKESWLKGLFKSLNMLIACAYK